MACLAIEGIVFVCEQRLWQILHYLGLVGQLLVFLC